MYRLVVLIYFFINLVYSNHDSYVLLVSFDGFRYDYTDFVETPNFDKLTKKGVKAEGLVPVFPSLTFPNHYSIATGSYSATHNITGNSFFDKKYGKEYSFRDREKVKDPKFYKSEPIWVTAERQGIKSASYYWVGTEAPVKGYSPSIFKYYDGSVSFEARVDSVISWFELPENNRPRLVMLYFSEPDYTGHKVGVNNLEINRTISAMDDLLGQLVNKLEKLDIFSSLNIIIVSDHGMVDVSSDRLIILDDYITRMSDIFINGRGAYVQFDLKNFELDFTVKFQDELKKIPHSQFWGKEDIPNRFHFNNTNTSDYLLLADEGWFITTKSSLSQEDFSIGGMHGYDPNLSSMHGIFYAVGANIKAGLQIPRFENIHIYPLICKLLDIIPYNGFEDSPSGNIKVLEKIIIQEK